jgi:hypothetical protein
MVHKRRHEQAKKQFDEAARRPFVGALSTGPCAQPKPPEGATPMERKDYKHDSALNSADLRTKKRKEGEALQAFEKIIDRFVAAPGTPKFKKPPKRSTHKQHEIVLWEATDP